jgi:hypothetical protein
MADDPLQRRADELAARVEALAAALHDGGVSEEASAQLLARASTAVLQALRLELLVEQAEQGERTEEVEPTDEDEAETEPLLAA